MKYFNINFLEVGEYYRLVRINASQNMYGNFDEVVLLENDNDGEKYTLHMDKDDNLYFYNYFYSEKEERKFKLNKINKLNITN